MLEKQFFDLAMQFLCRQVRTLSVGDRLDLQNLYGVVWQREGVFIVWQQAWLWLAGCQKPEFIRRTYAIDTVFAASVLDGVYAAELCRPVYLDRMD